jgi:hypothetical protein
MGRPHRPPRPETAAGLTADSDSRRRGEGALREPSLAIALPTSISGLVLGHPTITPSHTTPVVSGVLSAIR